MRKLKKCLKIRYIDILFFAICFKKITLVTAINQLFVTCSWYLPTEASAAHLQTKRYKHKTQHLWRSRKTLRILVIIQGTLAMGKFMNTFIDKYDRININLVINSELCIILKIYFVILHLQHHRLYRKLNIFPCPPLHSKMCFTHILLHCVLLCFQVRIMYMYVNGSDPTRKVSMSSL